VPRRKRKDYTTISIRKENRNLAEQILAGWEDGFDRIGVSSLSDLYEQALLLLKDLLDANRIDFPPDYGPKLRIKPLQSEGEAQK